MAKCKLCGAPVMMAILPSGEEIPVNLEPVTFWRNPKAKMKVVSLKGKVENCDLKGDPAKATGIGYIQHALTCPNADQHRKG